MLSRVLALSALLLMAAACATDSPTPEPGTPLPADVDLDPRWTAPIAWDPIPVDGGRVPLRGSLRPGVLQVSDALPLDVSFAVRRWELAETDWCDATTDRDQIVLAWKMGCVVTLRIVVPERVECPGSPDRPSAGQLAAALLAHPTLGAIDLGPAADSPILRPGLFAMPVHGRIVVIPGTERRFDPATANPDRCRMPLERGPVELRGDSDAFLVLLDVDDRLVVLHLATGGIDRETGVASRDRGYATTDDGGDADLYRGIMGAIGRISFGDAPPLR